MYNVLPKQHDLRTSLTSQVIQIPMKLHATCFFYRASKSQITSHLPRKGWEINSITYIRNLQIANIRPVQTSQATVRTWLPSKHGVSLDPLTLSSQNKNQNQFPTKPGITIEDCCSTKKSTKDIVEPLTSGKSKNYLANLQSQIYSSNPLVFHTLLIHHLRSYVLTYS